jgi:aldehyde dehydrogenase (NAD+)
VLVPERLRLPLIEALRKAIERFYGTDPRRSDSYGRIVNATHFERLRIFLTEGRVVVGGQWDEKDRYLAPTVLTDIPKDAAVLHEEIFGPILPVVGYEDLEQAIAFVRSRPKPLQFHLFTNDRQLQRRIINTMSAGTIMVNDSIVSQIVPGLPFGGVGNSGMGSFHGRYTFDAFSRPKSVLHRSFYADLDVRYPPFTAMKDRILRWLIS